TRESVANWPVAVPDFASIFTPPKEADVAATLAKFGLGGATGAEAGKLHHPLVFIAPGSVWATKRWTLDGFAAVTKHYLQRGFTVCLTGSPGERELCEQVVEKVGINENARGAERGSNRVEPLYAESDCVE